MATSQTLRHEVRAYPESATGEARLVFSPTRLDDTLDLIVHDAADTDLTARVTAAEAAITGANRKLGAWNRSPGRTMAGGPKPVRYRSGA